MIDYTKILSRRYDAEWYLNGDQYDGLTWLSDSPKPTKAQLEAQWEDVLAEIEAEKVQAENKRLAALAKLAELGLDADDLKVLGLG